MGELIQSLITLVPMTGNRTYIAAIGAVLWGLWLIYVGEWASGSELVAIAIMFIFKRASIDNLMAAISNRVSPTEPTFPTHEYPGGPNDVT